MPLSSDNITFATQLLAFLGFFGTCIVLFRYLDPRHEYFVLADKVGQLKRNWIRCDHEDLLPAGPSRMVLLRRVQNLEDQVVDFVYVTRRWNAICQLRAWVNIFHLKVLVNRARLLLTGLAIFSELNRDLREANQHSGSNVDPGRIQALKERSELITEHFIGLTGGPEPNKTLHFPPVHNAVRVPPVHDAEQHRRNRSGTTGSEDTFVSSSDSIIPGTKVSSDPESDVAVQEKKSEVKSGLRPFSWRFWRKKDSLPLLPC